MVPLTKSDCKQYIPKSWGQEECYWEFLNAQKVQQMLNTSAKYEITLWWTTVQMKRKSKSEHDFFLYLLKSEDEVSHSATEWNNKNRCSGVLTMLFLNCLQGTPGLLFLGSCGSLIFQLYLADWKENRIEFER